MEFTGERYVPEVKGQLRLEHVHRYVVAQSVVSGKDVLDVACGEGYGSSLLAQKARSVVGVDIAEEAVEHAGKRYGQSSNLSFLHGDATNLDFADASFDIVTSFETLEHLAEQEAMISEIHRVLRPNGLLVISSPNHPVYMTVNHNIRNEFHVKELNFDEFDHLLRSFFPTVRYYGQHLCVSSLVAPLAPVESVEPSAFCCHEIGDETSRGLGTLPVGASTYFVALCGKRAKKFAKSFTLSSALYRDPSSIAEELSSVASRDTKQRNSAWDLVAERDEAIAELHARIAEYDLQTSKNGDHIESLKNQLADYARCHSAFEERIRQLEAGLSCRDEQISSHEDCLSEREERINKLECDLSKRDIRLAQAVNSLSEKTAYIAELENQVASRHSLVSELTSVYASRSWRLTAPLRAGMGALRYCDRLSSRMALAFCLLPASLLHASSLGCWAKQIRHAKVFLREVLERYDTSADLGLVRNVVHKPAALGVTLARCLRDSGGILALARKGTRVLASEGISGVRQRMQKKAVVLGCETNSGPHTVAVDKKVGDINAAEISFLPAIEEEFNHNFYNSQVGQPFSKIAAIGHYFAVGWAKGYDPAPWFCTNAYLETYGDVRTSKINPFYHYIFSGRDEGRQVTPVDYNKATSQFDNYNSHWEHYDLVSSYANETREKSTPDLSLLDFTFSLGGSNLEKEVSLLQFNSGKQKKQKPYISIIIPCINNELLTAECLKSLACSNHDDYPLEVIIIDNASDDTLYTIIESHAGIVYHRFDHNVGFGRACNHGAEIAQGKYLFFLNNDVQVHPDSINALVTCIEDETYNPGIVGPKILNFDGTLQEAGTQVNLNGIGLLTGYGKNPATPRFCYRRRVEHISAAAIMISRELFTSLGGFDPRFGLAYCEDVDLSFKVQTKGLSVIYEPDALVAHHLSKSHASLEGSHNKIAQTAQNRATLVRLWGEKLSSHGLRTLAFFLPQYHNIPENDLWWGKGFTDWRNVTMAKPKFKGHNQPRVPTDLGFYDLANPAAMEEQALLATQYGIDGFCYYYYWFSGKRILHNPLERMLQSGRPKKPYCLCWANENWAKRWDGSDNEILLRQDYSEADAIHIIKDIAPYLRAENYISVNGRRLLLVYRVTDIPNPIRFFEVWRNYCRNNQIGEILIAMVESFSFAINPKNPTEYGCDVVVEFPAHHFNTEKRVEVEERDPSWDGEVYDYRHIARDRLSRVEPAFTRFRSVLVGWDNTPRYPQKSCPLAYATPGAFQAWLEWVYRRTLEQNSGDERIVFLSSWNEWAEGSYLEPDASHGRDFLQAVKNARRNVEFDGFFYE